MIFTYVKLYQRNIEGTIIKKGELPKEENLDAQKNDNNDALLQNQNLFINAESLI